MNMIVFTKEWRFVCAVFDKFVQEVSVVWYVKIQFLDVTTRYYK